MLLFCLGRHFVFILLKLSLSQILYLQLIVSYIFYIFKHIFEVKISFKKNVTGYGPCFKL